jgi:hypothetical protein
VGRKRSTYLGSAPLPRCITRLSAEVHPACPSAAPWSALASIQQHPRPCEPYVLPSSAPRSGMRTPSRPARPAIPFLSIAPRSCVIEGSIDIVSPNADRHGSKSSITFAAHGCICNDVFSLRSPRGLDFILPFPCPSRADRLGVIHSPHRTTLTLLSTPRFRQATHGDVNSVFHCSLFGGAS